MPQKRQVRDSVAGDFVDELFADVVAMSTKQNVFHRLWPRIFMEMVAEAALEMDDLEAFVRASDAT